MPVFVTRKSAANSMLENYGSKIDNALNSDKFSIEAISNSLQKQYEELERIALNAYKSLKCKGNDLITCEAELNNRIEALQQGVSFLNGKELEKHFLRGLRNATAYSPDMQLLYSKLVKKAEESAMKALNTNNVEEERIAEQLFNEISDNIYTNLKFIESGKRSVATNLLTNKRVSAPRFSRYFAELSKQTQKRIREKFAEEEKKSRLPVNVDNVRIEEEIGDNLKLDIDLENLNDDFALNFMKMSSEDRRLLTQNQNIVNYVNNYMKAQLLGKYSGEYKKYFQEAINQLLQTDKLAFFVGENMQDFTGILGELQGLYYIKVLLGGNIKRTVDWIGKNNEHADLLLKSALGDFGIQVKNSSRDSAMHEIEFQTFGTKSKTIDGITKSLTQYSGNFIQTFYTTDASNNLSKLGFGDLLTSIENILGMHTFNIEYIWENSRAVAKSNEDFQDTRRKIEEYSAKAQKIMALASIATMYMQTTTTSARESNTLYLIAGATVISAASILKNIINEVNKNLESFKFKMKTTLNPNSPDYTIVDYFNAGKGEHRFHVALTSSYTFSK